MANLTIANFADIDDSITFSNDLRQRKTSVEIDDGIDTVNALKGAYPVGDFHNAINYSKKIDDDTTLNVGVNGDYSTINAALNYANKINKGYKAHNPLININLKTGFVMAEQVVCDGIDMSFVRIISEDATVSITRSALSPRNIPGLDYNSAPAFLASRGGKLPIIAALFTMDSSGTASVRQGVMVAWGATAIIESGCGVLNAGDRGLYAVNAVVYARGTKWNGAGGRGIRIGNASIANLRGSEATGCGEYNLAVDGASNVTAQECNFSGGLGDSNVLVDGGSIVNLHDSNLTSSAGVGLKVNSNSKVSAQKVDVSSSVGRGLSVTSSQVDFGEGIANNCGDVAISGARNSSINAFSASCLNSGSVNAVLASAMSHINFQGGVAGSTGANVAIGGGSHINILSTTVTANTAINTLSDKGVIYG